MFCFALNSSKLWWDNPPWNVTTVDFFVAVPAQSTCFQLRKKYNLEISRRVVPKPLSCLWLCTWMSVQYSFVLGETINFFELNWIELNWIEQSCFIVYSLVFSLSLPLFTSGVSISSIWFQCMGMQPILIEMIWCCKNDLANVSVTLIPLFSYCLVIGLGAWICILSQ